MKKTVFLFGLILTLNGFGQYDINDIKNDSTSASNFSWFKLKQRIYVGGEVGLSFGTNSSYIHLSPIVGYDITEKLSAGFLGMYQLWHFKDFYDNSFNYHSYGGGIFTRFRPIPQIITQLEFDLFNTNDFASGTLDRVNVPAFMLGLGYANDFGNGAYYQIMLMYDFINDPNMPLPPLLFPQLHLKMGFIWHLGAN